MTSPLSDTYQVDLELGSVYLKLAMNDDLEFFCRMIVSVDYDLTGRTITMLLKEDADGIVPRVLKALTQSQTDLKSEALYLVHDVRDISRQHGHRKCFSGVRVNRHRCGGYGGGDSPVHTLVLDYSDYEID